MTAVVSRARRHSRLLELLEREQKHIYCIGEMPEPTTELRDVYLKHDSKVVLSISIHGSFAGPASLSSH
jgi:hypothetical protein